MPDKSKRELKRELEVLQADRPTNFEISSLIHTIMDWE